MINLGTQYSTSMPSAIELTDDAVFLAKDIEAYSKEIEGHTVSGYKYTCIKYSKDEYIISLAEELKAAKILLGVD